MRPIWRSVGTLVLAGTMAIVGTAAAQTPPPAPANAGDLAVTVTYKGAGEVKASNEISIFLFDTPTINAESQPIGMQTIEKNGGVANFTNLPATVYIAVVFDEKGVYDQQGPPPTGTPLAIHSEKNGPSLPVSTGKGAKVSITFDDTIRMP